MRENVTSIIDSGAGGWSEAQWVAVASGNTRTRVARFRGSELVGSVTLVNAERGSWTVAALEPAGDGEAPALAVVASVNPGASEAVEALLARRIGEGQVLRIGRDVPLALRHRLDDPSRLGQDRALNAIAAFERAQQACVVIDAGTAVTVDFIDGEGAFCGGAIAPGLNLMLQALHEHTALLPALRYAMPAPGEPPYGTGTEAAMQRGVAGAVRGLLRELLDRYAEAYGGYPQVIATGGDAAVLEETGLVEHFVPDLQLMGIAACLKRAVDEDDEGGPADGDLAHGDLAHGEWAEGDGDL